HGRTGRIRRVRVRCVSWLRLGLRLPLEVKVSEVVVEGSVLLHQHDDRVDWNLGPMWIPPCRDGRGVPGAEGAFVGPGERRQGDGDGRKNDNRAHEGSVPQNLTFR